MRAIMRKIKSLLLIFVALMMAFSLCSCAPQEEIVEGSSSGDDSYRFYAFEQNFEIEEVKQRILDYYLPRYEEHEGNIETYVDVVYDNFDLPRFYVLEISLYGQYFRTYMGNIYSNGNIRPSIAVRETKCCFSKKDYISCKKYFIYYPTPRIEGNKQDTIDDNQLYRMTPLCCAVEIDGQIVGLCGNIENLVIPKYEKKYLYDSEV